MDTVRDTAGLLNLLADQAPIDPVGRIRFTAPLLDREARQFLRDFVLSTTGLPVQLTATGAIGDGASHPLSDYYGTLAAAQAVYPAAVALTDEIDWAAIQKALNTATAAATGGLVQLFAGRYRINRPLVWGTNVTLRGHGASTILDARLATMNLCFGQNKTFCAVERVTMVGNGIGALAVLFDTCPGSTVRGCNISGFTQLNVAGYGGGVHMYLSDDSTIEDNDFSGNGVLVGGLTSDIQINGNGVAVDCTKRVKVHNNRCLSTTVQTNIVCYDVAWSSATENICTGAKTQASNNNGYGIIFYKTVNANAGTARRNRIEDNLVYSVGGTAIYVQAQDDCACVGNIGEDWGAVQDDTTLLVGFIGYSNSPRGTITGNEGINGFKAGIVIAGATVTLEGYTVSGNSFTHMNGGYGIYLRGALQKSSFSNNTLKDCGNGIGTPPVDQGIEGCTFDGNTVDGTTSGYGFQMYGTARCTFTGNSVFHSWRSGFLATGASPGNIFIGNHSWDGSLAGDNLYNAFELGACTDTIIMGNYGGNTGVTGYKWGVFVPSNANRSQVTGNKMGGCRTANYSVDNTYASAIAFWGNFDLSVADAQFFAVRQQMRIQGASSSVTQLLMGDASNGSALFTRFSGGDIGMCQNAVHVVQAGGAVDLFHQSNAANASKLLILRVNGSMEFYSAPAGTADGNFATFWGTAKAAFSTGGSLNINGTQVVGARSTGWTPMTGTADKATAMDVTTVTLLQLAQRVNSIQATLTSTHGLFGP